MSGRGVKVWAVTAICAQVLCACAEEVRVIRVADYGVISNDGLDDTPAVQAALRACAGAPTRLVFGPGQYDLYPDRAPERYLFVSNNDEGLKRIAFPLEKSEGLEVDGQGARFMFRGWITPFALDHAKGTGGQTMLIPKLRIQYLKQIPIHSLTVKHHHRTCAK